MDWRDWDAPRSARSRKWNPVVVYEAGTARKWWLTGSTLAVLVLVAGLLCQQPPRYSAETQVLTGPRTVGLIGLRPALSLFGGTSSSVPAANQAQLIASRDLARRAIKDLRIEGNPEFDPVAQSQGPVFRSLIFLGLMRDPARKSPDDRLLEAYQDRLQVSAPSRGSLVTITFQSEDRELAAKAANRIAELYLEMHAGANALPSNDGARIVSRAITPVQPLYPKKALLLLSSAAMLIMTFGGFVSFAAAGRRLAARLEEPVEQPQVLGPDRVFAYLTEPAKSSPRPDSELAPQFGQLERDDGGNRQATAKIMGRILSVPFDGLGARGTRIIATSLGPAAAASGMMRDLAQDLAREGRSIVVGLDESSFFDFRRLAAGAPHSGTFAASVEPGLCDLLDGTASFAEVIRRDPGSRLHFLRVGRDSELKLDEFTHVLDALAGTYDFLLMIAPPLDQNSIAEIVSAKADFAVLMTPAGPQGGTIFEAEARLIEAGAREVLLIGLPSGKPQGLGRDAA